MGGADRLIIIREGVLGSAGGGSLVTIIVISLLMMRGISRSISRSISTVTVTVWDTPFDGLGLTVDGLGGGSQTP